MKNVCIIVIVSCLVLFSCKENDFEYISNFELAEQQIIQLESRYHIKVYYQYFSYYISENWLYNKDVTAMPDVDLYKNVNILTSVLDKYPDEFIRANLKEVYYFKTFKLNGIERGTHAYENAIVFVGGTYTDWTVHHEFAHCVHLKNIEYFPEDNWTEMHPDDFEYSGHIWYYPMNTSYTEEYLHENGFLYLYNTTTILEDFADYVADHYVKRDQLEELSSQFEAIHIKYTLFKEFYNSLGAEIE